jgi:hypothetical protein
VNRTPPRPLWDYFALALIAMPKVPGKALCISQLELDLADNSFNAELSGANSQQFDLFSSVFHIALSIAILVSGSKFVESTN